MLINNVAPILSFCNINNVAGVDKYFCNEGTICFLVGVMNAGASHLSYININAFCRWFWSYHNQLFGNYAGASHLIIVKTGPVICKHKCVLGWDFANTNVFCARFCR